MVLPIGNKALQEIWASKEGAIERCYPPKGDMVTATRTGMASIDLKFLCDQVRLLCCGENPLR